MPRAPFPITPELAAVAIAYKNTSLIADMVLPRVMVGKQQFRYNKHSLSEGFTVPDTRVSRRSRPNEVTFSSEEVESSTEDYALDDPLPYADLENQQEGFDPEANSVEMLNELIMLSREVRASELVFNTQNYGAKNKMTLSGSDKWDHDDSDPIATIMDSLDAMVMRGNKAVIGQKVWSNLRRHKDIVKAVHKTAGDTGAASVGAVAELFELEELIIGRAWVNSAKKGQTPSLKRTWGNAMVLFYQNQMSMPQNQLVTFGFTAQWGDRVAGSMEDPDIGMRGGKRIRTGESVRELVIANDLGYMINEPIT